MKSPQNGVTPVRDRAIHLVETDKPRRIKMDRSEINRALAKAIAYKNCNKQTEAEQWAKKLIELLECADILR
jgi:hypothetical protein